MFGFTFESYMEFTGRSVSLFPDRLSRTLMQQPDTITSQALCCSPLNWFLQDSIL
jgi:hypothetical protein